MISKIFASIILITVLYILGVFLAPNLSDSLAENFGISSMNSALRQLKDGVDNTSDTLLQIKDASGAINNVRSIVDEANKKINQTTDAVQNIRQTGEEKVEQVKKTAESIKKAEEAITTVRNNINELTTLSGAKTLSGEVNMSGSSR